MPPIIAAAISYNSSTIITRGFLSSKQQLTTAPSVALLFHRHSPLTTFTKSLSASLLSRHLRFTQIQFHSRPIAFYCLRTMTMPTASSINHGSRHRALSNSNSATTATTTTTIKKNHAKRSTTPSTSKRMASFAFTAFIATTTASASYAAYYYATMVLFAGGSIAGVSGDTSADDGSGGSGGGTKKGLLGKGETKKEDHYGFEYVGFDTYPGTHNNADYDSNNRNRNKNADTAAAVAIVAEAMAAAGLDESETIINFGNDDDEGGGENQHGKYITLNPKHHHRSIHNGCPLYGCPFLPLDIHYDEVVKKSLESMRAVSSSSSSSSSDEDGKTVKEKDGRDFLLKSSGSEREATLTLIGYKGGRLEDQVNQDRAFVLSPYLFWNIGGGGNGGGDSSATSMKTKPKVARLLGVFDGHARFGEKVSEYVVRMLPPLLGNKLVNYDAALNEDKSSETNNDETETTTTTITRDRDIVQILHDTFLELDATSPADPSGGCTASVVLQLDSKVYIANAGDSRSFVAVHIVPPVSSDSGSASSSSSTGDNDNGEATTAILFATREDKPHLSGEQKRVEKMGGSVYLPPGFLASGQGTTRVMYKDPTSGGMSGLAMSRSLGDWDAEKVGVIPDPLVDILDLKEMKSKVLQELNNGACANKLNAVEIDPASGEAKEIGGKGTCVEYTEKDIKVFAFSATDGLLDYLPEDVIAQHVAKGLYNTPVSSNEDKENTPGKTHPLTACEDLIYAAANGWQESKGGRYRDDIAIAVADLED